MAFSVTSAQYDSSLATTSPSVRMTLSRLKAPRTSVFARSKFAMQNVLAGMSRLAVCMTSMPELYNLSEIFAKTST
ncbi:hypothetical protein [Cohnella rhizosphaerae]|uniref:Uncharacterized protein n=1 Tax=Cohnella rhizosphaerae TaxID=1457232 RepID=A0A9X4QWQ4_9BACL|nr:hypothetical protein [Cohnella rhizosphaerae]MDG0812592.1 hypothetical protein [Cohnella rhizosphaerae]